MAQPKHKPREVKNKTMFDRLKESALVILLFIILFIVDIVTFIFWLSSLLSSKPGYDGLGIVNNKEFFIFAGLGLFLAVFFGVATIVQRRAHGS